MSEKKSGKRMTIYVPAEMAEELKKIGQDQDRTTSWLLKRAWKLSKNKIESIPPIPTP